MSREYIVGGVSPVYVSETGTRDEILIGVYLSETTTTAVTVAPGVGTVVVTGLAPTVAVSDLVAVTPGAGTAVITGLAPTIAITGHVVVEPGVGSIVINGLAPTSAGGEATSVATPDVGGSGGRRRRQQRRRIEVEIDGEVFEVASEQEGHDLLMQARKLAEQAAQAKAEKAIAKAQRKATPASQDRAFAVPAPKIEFRAADNSELLAQQVRAQVEAAQAEIDAIYERVLAKARVRFIEIQQDEDDALAVILMS